MKHLKIGLLSILLLVALFMGLPTTGLAKAKTDASRNDVLWIHSHGIKTRGRIIALYTVNAHGKDVRKAAGIGYYWRLSKNKKKLIKAGEMRDLPVMPASGELDITNTEQGGQRLKVARGAIYEKLIFTRHGIPHTYWIWWGYMSRGIDFVVGTQ